MKPLLILILCVITFVAGGVIRLQFHTCPDAGHDAYPTRVQMQEFLGTKADGYIGPIDNEAWRKYEMNLIALEIDGDKYETQD